jgi:hypothetical protein
MACNPKQWAWALLCANISKPINEGLANVAILSPRRAADVELHVTAWNKPQDGMLREHAYGKDGLKDFSPDSHPKRFNPLTCDSDSVAGGIEIQRKL